MRERTLVQTRTPFWDLPIGAVIQAVAMSVSVRVRVAVLTLLSTAVGHSMDAELQFSTSQRLHRMCAQFDQYSLTSAGGMSIGESNEPSTEGPGASDDPLADLLDTCTNTLSTVLQRADYFRPTPAPQQSENTSPMAHPNQNQLSPGAPYQQEDQQGAQQSQEAAAAQVAPMDPVEGPVEPPSSPAVQAVWKWNGGGMQSGINLSNSQCTFLQMLLGGHPRTRHCKC